MFFDDLNGIIANIGTLNSYIGFISDELPQYSSDSIYATSSNSNQKFYFEKINPQLNRSLKIHKLIEKNKIVDIENYVAFIEKMTSKVNGNLSEQPLLLICKENDNINEERKKCAELFFEEHKSPCLYFANEAVASLFVHGSYNGLLLNSGAHETSLYPIHDGFLIKKEINRLPFGGEHLTDLFNTEIIKKSNYSFEPQYNIIYNPNFIFTNKEKLEKDEKVTKIKRLKLDPTMQEHFLKKDIRELKEQLLGSKKLIFTPKTLKENDKEVTINTTTIDLPDKTTIEFTENELKHYENYFFENKSTFKDSIELQMEIFKTITKCDNDIKKELFGKIFITGGNSLMNNFSEELENKISQMQIINTKIKVSSSSRKLDKQMAPWIGGSILGSTSAFQNLWIGRFEYQECGENIIYRKCVN